MCLHILLVVLVGRSTRIAFLLSVSGHQTQLIVNCFSIALRPLFSSSTHCLAVLMPLLVWSMGLDTWMQRSNAEHGGRGSKLLDSFPKGPKWLKHLLRRCFGVVFKG